MDQDKAINDIIAQYRDLLEAISTFRDYTEDQLNWRPTAVQWSMAECIEHIRLTSHVYAEQIDLAIDRSPESLHQAESSYRLGLFARFFIWMMEPRGKKIPNKVKTTTAFIPDESAFNADLLIDNTTKVIEDNITLLERMRTLAVMHIKVPLPVTNLIKLPILDALTFVASHNRRHVQQARNVLDYERFPHEQQGPAFA